jgi:hypothetical protein
VLVHQEVQGLAVLQVQVEVQEHQVRQEQVVHRVVQVLPELQVQDLQQLLHLEVQEF